MRVESIWCEEGQRAINSTFDQCNSCKHYWDIDEECEFYRKREAEFEHFRKCEDGERKRELQLFIWAGFCSDHTEGLAFAIATNEANAKLRIENEYGLTVYEWGNLEIRSLDGIIARCVSGGG